MDLHIWLLYLVAATGLSLTPGPNSLLALTHGALHGHRRTLWTVGGGALGFAVVIALSMLGIGALLQASASALLVLKWVGGAYLVWRVAVPPDFRKYVFAKGYIAIHGASLTVAEVNRAEGWFEVWLIPETRRATVFEDKRAGDVLNIEIERSTQVVVDTVREAVHESLGRLQPVLEALLKEKGLSLDDFVQAPVVPH